MNYALETPVGEIVADRPSRAKVFQRHGIDFCCRGNHTLGDACAAIAVNAEAVLTELREDDAHGAFSAEPDWTTQSLTALISHIVSTHHRYLRSAMPQISALAEKVAAKHGADHIELSEIRGTFEAVREELDSHMMKEEMILFPAIQKLESGLMSKAAAGQLMGPMSVMLTEHESAGRALERMRALSSGYQPPEGACNSYSGLFDSLREFETDLHLHIHKENNILFPRALDSDELYDQLRASVEARFV